MRNYELEAYYFEEEGVRAFYRDANTYTKEYVRWLENKLEEATLLVTQSGV
jgi:hypothetical protein